MTNEELNRIYTEGNAVSHTHALRAVFEAGKAAATPPPAPDIGPEPEGYPGAEPFMPELPRRKRGAK